MTTLCTRLFVQVLRAYLTLMTSYGELLGGIYSNRILIQIRMQEVIAFEKAIAKVDRSHCGPLVSEQCTG